MGKAPKILDHSFLVGLARKSQRKRAKWSVPAASGNNSYIFVVMDPSAYVRPHCHPKSFFLGPDGTQFMVVLSGAVGLITIDPKTGNMKKTLLSASGGESAVEIPAGVYHSCVALEANTVILEVVQKGARKQYLQGSPRPETAQAKALVKLWSKAPATPFKSPLLKAG